VDVLRAIAALSDADRERLIQLVKALRGANTRTLQLATEQRRAIDHWRTWTAKWRLSFTLRDRDWLRSAPRFCFADLQSYSTVLWATLLLLRGAESGPHRILFCVLTMLWV
jgi:hypothetical protein